MKFSEEVIKKGDDIVELFLPLVIKEDKRIGDVQYANARKAAIILCKEIINSFDIDIQTWESSKIIVGAFKHSKLFYQSVILYIQSLK